MKGVETPSIVKCRGTATIDIKTNKVIQASDSEKHNHEPDDLKRKVDHV